MVVDSYVTEQEATEYADGKLTEDLEQFEESVRVVSEELIHDRFSFTAHWA